MNTIWILIMTFSSAGSVHASSIQTVEFSSEHNCFMAAVEWLKDNAVDSKKYKISAICVKK